MEQALLFIPDISGFTSFITSTERIHSGHLISELLEIVIAENTLEMEVQEVEGDAVFFLRSGEAPEVHDLLAQARQMFLAFHAHLRVIERDNVCQCGACRTASNLTLKFAVHYGEVEKTLVAGRNNVMGSDVILVHRLLKNAVPDREYLLLPARYPSEIVGGEGQAWADWQEYTEEFEHFGNVPLRYVPFAPLIDEVPQLEQPQDVTPHGSAKTIDVHIDAPLLLVHAMLTDPDAKKEYTPELKDSVTPTPINRVNSSHTCVFEDFEVHFVTRQHSVRDKEITYKETGEVSVGFSFIADYRLRERDDGTDVRLNIFPSVLVQDKGASGIMRAFRWMKTQLLFRGALRGTRKNIHRFKLYCERVAQSEAGEAYRTPGTS